MLDTDSKDYHVLENAARSITNVPGLVVEIGTRRGGSTKFIIDALQDRRNVVCIDPYGNLPYPHGDNSIITNDYTNSMKNDTFAALFEYVKTKNVNLIPVFLEDTEFFEKFSQGFPVYHEKKEVFNEYALVFFDGPHEPEAVLREAKFFCERSVPGTYFVFDDWQDFTFNGIDSYLIENRFQKVEETDKKVSYVKR